jgi:hypothetical protein
VPREINPLDCLYNARGVLYFMAKEVLVSLSQVFFFRIPELTRFCQLIRSLNWTIRCAFSLAFFVFLKC